MGTITVACRQCGMVNQDVAKIRAIPLGSDSEALFVLDCPVCGQLIVHLTDPRHPLPPAPSWWRVIVDDLRTLWHDGDPPSLYR